MSKLLPSTLQQAAHIQAFDDLIAGRFDAVPVEAVLVYIIDMVNAQALPYLAEQFDILGIKGYIYATTEEEKRDTVRNAIELHRYKGTPWAVKEALSKIGLVVNRIEEGVGQRTFYNGVYNRNGSRTRGSLGHWAYFRVYLNTAQNTVISATQIADAVAIINEYKNVRSHLYDITVEVNNIADTLAPADSISIAADATPDDDFGTYYNGLYTRNGTRTRANIADTVTDDVQAIDTDAATLFAAITAQGGTTTQQEQDAANDAIIELKFHGLWSKIHAAYFMIGGTASSHKLNAKNPADTNAAFRLSYNGGWTHSSTGAMPNGINAYADTFYVPATHGAAASQHISYYSRSNTSGVCIEMGCGGTAGGAGQGQLFIAPNISGTAYRAVNTTGNSASGISINTAAMFTASRTDATFMRLHRNATQLYNDGGLPNTASNRSIYIGARNASGTADGFSSRECAWASIGEGLSAAEAVTLNTIITAFQTALGRNV